ncbi:MAG TPA: cadherin-like domain-containing protein, partial [Chryseolinea sp.]|nr:cadherin-like domain-containing protein [Chryseolinea sp.]
MRFLYQILLSFFLFLSLSSYAQVPSIDGQNTNPIIINEGQSHTVVFGDLIVTDADDTYPTGFTLTVLAGTDYTVSTHTITPTADFNGTLSVNVQVTDAALNLSNVFPLQIQVDAVNDAPVITGQNLVTINEDQGRLIAFSDLLISDPDNTYPTGFTLTVSGGTNYTFVGNTITPTSNFNGMLNVNVLVNDGAANSNIFPLEVTVDAVNDVPVITGQNAVTINEDQGRLIAFSDLLISDPDNTYPTGFTLTVSSGTNYTFVGNT